MVNNALLVNNRGFAFFWPDVRSARSFELRTRDGYLFRFGDSVLQVVFEQNSLISGALNGNIILTVVSYRHTSVWILHPLKRLQ